MHVHWQDAGRATAVGRVWFSSGGAAWSRHGSQDVRFGSLGQERMHACIHSLIIAMIDGRAWYDHGRTYKLDDKLKRLNLREKKLLLKQLIL